jgi:hypothetical protein
MGCALYTYNHLLNQPRGMAVYSAYTGSQFTNEEIEIFLKEKGIEYSRLSDEELFEKRNDPLNPQTRFVKYSPSTRRIIIPCPQVNLLNGPPEITGCPLPNTILNSTIPK